jgi:hypothetical protein
MRIGDVRWNTGSLPEHGKDIGAHATFHLWREDDQHVSDCTDRSATRNDPSPPPDKNNNQLGQSLGPWSVGWMWV